MEAEGLQACGQTTTDEMFLVIRIWAFCHLMIISRDYGTYIQTEVETSVSFQKAGMKVKNVCSSKNFVDRPY